MSLSLCICRARRSCVVVRAEEKATLDLNEGVEGGTDYSGILAGGCSANTLLLKSCCCVHVCWHPCSAPSPQQLHLSACWKGPCVLPMLCSTPGCWQTLCRQQATHASALHSVTNDGVECAEVQVGMTEP